MLESRAISKYFLNKRALEDVTLRIEPGRIYALLGPNGSGKTTWMKIAASLTKPSAGEMLFDGDPVGICSRRSVAYMSTEPYFYSWMTIRDVGRYYEDFFEDFSMELFRELLGKMELSEELKVKNLSSGMMAKLKIAVTIARRARVYLLDEPLNGIDLIARDRIMETIVGSLEEGVSLVLSSHLVEEIETVVDTAVFIRGGKIVEICDTENLRSEHGQSLADRYREIMQ
ncbi:ABC transporter ATP-binding protein [Lachnoclostridium sp. Marseille-P6806]|uniref:ABC transporter ATP-binding protein n=1 Tax=Lachnoclostridium sp. Marseille-P6806 TaxID=2364793 RepID=UPI001030E506|nr:ABC transporter ATP-binding protein [Lachnoclostridium sp. Marseille-P6806]